MEQKIITAPSAEQLNQKIVDAIKEGWCMIGEHKVVTKHAQNRFAGMQHKDTIYDIEYSQTICKYPPRLREPD